MAYVSLYRKYRPQTFDDVVGQDHVTRTLRNALEEDRLSHAYLFTGPRGTGKTSTARILAKAINCEAGPTPTPCGTCGQCTAIAAGNSVDVIELDMASHGGVDDARELRDRALFSPASARRKVYILDEVHMASTAAFNALLKLIEEPPGHVLFAMATTDPQKVLPTIMSRVQRLDLRRVAASEVAAHVRSLCDAEGYAIDDGALEAVVRAGDGSVRDTLSVLEQVLAFAGREVTAEAVAQTLGTTPTERVIETVDLIGTQDLAGLLSVVQRLIDDGHDLRRFTLDLVQHLRDLLVLQVAPDRPDLVDATDERRRRLQAQTTVLPRVSLLRAVELLAGTVAEQRQGSPRLPLELALATLAVPGTSGDLAELADRVARLEAGATSRQPAPAVEAAPPASAAAPVPEPTPAPDPAPPTPTPEPTPAPDPAPPTPTPEPTPAPDPAPPTPAPDPTPEPPAPAPEPAPAPTPEPPAPDPAPPTATPDPTPEPPAPEPAPTPTPAADAGTDGSADEQPPGDDSDLATIQAHWEGILERLKQGSRRHHAMFEPAVPVAAGRGILTLRYGQRHASFHAVQARTGELDQAMRDAVAQACGLRVKLDIVIDGDDHRRRPLPPSVTPDDARTPVFDDGGGADGTVSSAAERGSPAPDTSATSGPSRPVAQDHTPAATDEGTEVREAEAGVAREDVDIDDLLGRELGATLLEELPPPGEAT